jgi:hypothetical protein
LKYLPTPKTVAQEGAFEPERVVDFVKGTNSETSGIPLLAKEGRTRHQENVAKPPAKRKRESAASKADGADGGRSPRKPDRAQPLRDGVAHKPGFKNAF